MVKIILNEKDSYFEVNATEGMSSATTHVTKKNIEKYQRGEIKNDPMRMAESVVKQCLKDSSKRNKH